MNLELLRTFIASYPAQPATAWWRAVEVQALLRVGLPGGSGLDVGCGDGKLTRIVLELAGGRDLTGVDLDPAETASATACGAYREVYTAPAAAIPCADGAFDFAFSNSVLEHVRDLEPVIGEVSRVLKPGGSFLVTVPTVGFHLNLRGPLWPFVSRHRYLSAVDRRLAHFHYLDTAGWRDLLRRNNLELTYRFGYLDRAEIRRWEQLSRWTGGLLYALGGGRSRPIEIQRQLGLRQMQQHYRWPTSVAGLIARICATGLMEPAAYWSSDPGLADQEAACLLLVARRH